MQRPPKGRYLEARQAPQKIYMSYSLKSLKGVIYRDEIKGILRGLSTGILGPRCLDYSSYKIKGLGCSASRALPARTKNFSTRSGEAQAVAR